MTANPLRSKALLMLVTAALLWGVSFPVLKAIGLIHRGAIPESGSWFITTWSVGPRFLIAGVLLAVARAGLIGGITRLEFKQGAGLAFFAALGLLFQVDGLQYIEASVSAFLTQIYVVLIPLYIAWKYRRRPRILVIASCVLVLTGVGVLARLDPGNLKLGRGEWETVLGSVFFAGQILWLERPEFAVNRATRVTLVMFALLGVGFTIISAVLAPRVSDLLVLWADPGWLTLTLVLAVVCTLFCFSAMNRWQPHITATEAGLIYSLEPVSVAFLVLFLPGVISALTSAGYGNEVPTWHLVVGGTLITVANLMVVLRRPQPPPSTP